MIRNFIFFVLLLLSGFSSSGQDAMSVRVLRSGLFIPWDITYGYDDHIWFTQKNGYICRMDTSGYNVEIMYHEQNTATYRESGMLGMVMHPDFDYQPFVYVAWEYLRASDNTICERVTRYTYSATGNVLTAPKVLIDNIKGAAYHNGCRLVIDDDKLFITLGDAGDSASAQNVGSVNGKVLRINLDGSVPADNPIPGNPVWSWGHRNAQGLTMGDGILYSSEHGPDTDDEVNIITKGANYGWPYARGNCNLPKEDTFCQANNVTEPIASWSPTIAPCGMEYYNHPMFPSLRKSLLMTTLKDKHLYQLRLNDSGTAVKETNILSNISFGRLRDVCFSREGKIYISTSNSEPDGKGPFIDQIIEVTNPAWAEHKMPSFIIYPNPAADEVYLIPPFKYSKLRYTITDMYGRNITAGYITPALSNIDIRDLAEGVYPRICS